MAETWRTPDMTHPSFDLPEAATYFAAKQTADDVETAFNGSHSDDDWTRLQVAISEQEAAMTAWRAASKLAGVSAT